MYRIIGGDGREYGPVSTEQLRQWMADGRANAQTKARIEDGADWKPLGELPEFAGVFAMATPPPPIESVNTQRWVEQVLARDFSLDIGSCINRGWDLVFSNFWLLVGASFVGGVIQSAGIFGLILGGPMIGGLYALYLKKARGQPAAFGDAFIGFNLFVPLMLAHIVCAVLGMAGLILCIIPGIYFGVCWMFTMPLVIEKKMDFWPAMELSRQVVSKHWWTLFGLSIVAGLVGMLGVLACLVGLVVTLPVAFAAHVYAYEDIFGQHSTSTP